MVVDLSGVDDRWYKLSCAVFGVLGYPRVTASLLLRPVQEKAT